MHNRGYIHSVLCSVVTNRKEKCNRLLKSGRISLSLKLGVKKEGAERTEVLPTKELWKTLIKRAGLIDVSVSKHDDLIPGDHIYFASLDLQQKGKSITGENAIYPGVGQFLGT